MLVLFWPLDRFREANCKGLYIRSRNSNDSYCSSNLHPYTCICYSSEKITDTVLHTWKFIRFRSSPYTQYRYRTEYIYICTVLNSETSVNLFDVLNIIIHFQRCSLTLKHGQIWQRGCYKTCVGRKQETIQRCCLNRWGGDTEHNLHCVGFK